ncbi:MAG: hypothetical protein ACK4MS_10565 [Paracoccaceae bacterium]
MFKFGMSATLSAAVFVGWQYWNASIGDLTAVEARAVMAVLAEGHGGRGAGLQEPILKKPDGTGWVLCGWVRIGGVDSPLGSQPFLGRISGKGDFSIASLAVTRSEANAVHDACAYRGMKL